MTITAQDVIDQAREITRDTSGAVLTDARGIAWVNDAQRTVAVVRPDAYSEVAVVQLSQASKQTLAATRRRVLGITRNMGADGLTAGNAISGPVPQETLDLFDRSWHQTSGSEVLDYVYNLETPTVWYVRPFVNGTWYVEGRFALEPTDATATTDVLTVQPVYAPALIEWVVYRRFSQDAETTPNFQRAGRHFQNFFSILGAKTQADLAVDPRALEAQ
jgi:hypothetical protein